MNIPQIATRALASLWLVCGASAQTGLIGVESDASGRYYSIDPDTAAATFLGILVYPSGTQVPLTGALSAAPDGFLYSVSYPSAALYRFDPATFTAIAVGEAANPTGFEGGLAIGPDGRAFYANGGSALNPELWRVDLTDGSRSIVGDLTSGSRDLNGLAMREDGQLLAVDRESNSVVEIDPNTAVVTELAPVPGVVGASGGLVRSEGRWFFATSGPGSSVPGSNELYEITDPYTGAMTLIGPITGVVGDQGLSALSSLTYGLVGTTYCPVASNSVGLEAQIFGTGSRAASMNDLTLWATDLPSSRFAIFIAGSDAGFVANPGGSSGNLCLSGSIGRFVASGGTLNSGESGAISLTIDLQQVPTQFGPVAIQAGDTYYFQAWYRDAVNGTGTSNFTGGLEVLFE